MVTVESRQCRLLWQGTLSDDDDDDERMYFNVA